MPDPGGQAKLAESRTGRFTGSVTDWSQPSETRPHRQQEADMGFEAS
jgi:hypothetical protein